MEGERGPDAPAAEPVGLTNGQPPDAKVDAGEDAKPDAEMDAEVDAKPDAKVDAKVDAREDAKPGSGEDVGKDMENNKENDNKGKRAKGSSGKGSGGGRTRATSSHLVGVNIDPRVVRAQRRHANSLPGISRAQAYPVSRADVTAVHFPTPSLGFMSPDQVLLYQHQLILFQVEYYFSVQNLCKDIFLRKNMDNNGWVPLRLVCSFNRIRRLTESESVVRDALRASFAVEVRGSKLRKRHDWAFWILKADGTPNSKGVLLSPPNRPKDPKLPAAPQSALPPGAAANKDRRSSNGSGGGGVHQDASPKPWYSAVMSSRGAKNTGPEVAKGAGQAAQPTARSKRGVLAHQHKDQQEGVERQLQHGEAPKGKGKGRAPTGPGRHGQAPQALARAAPGENVDGVAVGVKNAPQTRGQSDRGHGSVVVSSAAAARAKQPAVAPRNKTGRPGKQAGRKGAKAQGGHGRVAPTTSAETRGDEGASGGVVENVAAGQQGGEVEEEREGEALEESTEASDAGEASAGGGEVAGSASGGDDAEREGDVGQSERRALKVVRRPAKSTNPGVQPRVQRQPPSQSAPKPRAARAIVAAPPLSVQMAQLLQSPLVLLLFGAPRQTAPRANQPSKQEFLVWHLVAVLAVLTVAVALYVKHFTDLVSPNNSA